MTAMLASVTSLAEARTVLQAGADIIDLKDPAQGALGALAHATVRHIVTALEGRAALSATVGDLPLQPALLASAVAAMAATGVDYVKVGLFAGARQVECIEALAPLCAQGARVVIVLFADQQPDFSLLAPMADTGCAGVMLDTADKSRGGLRDCLSARALGAFVEQAQALDLLVGLAGSLQLADIPPLLQLAPDYLGFRGALCAANQRTQALDPAALAAVRAAIPLSVSAAVP